MKEVYYMAVLSTGYLKLSCRQGRLLLRSPEDNLPHISLPVYWLEVFAISWVLVISHQALSLTLHGIHAVLMSVSKFHLKRVTISMGYLILIRQWMVLP